MDDDTDKKTVNDRRALHYARVLFDDLANLFPDLRANRYCAIEQYFERPEDYPEALGISLETFGQRKHAAFIIKGKYVLGQIREGKKDLVPDFVREIAGNRYSLAEIDLTAEEFKTYATPVALVITKEAVNTLHDSWRKIAVIMTIAGMSDGDEARSQILETANEASALSEFI